MQVLTRSQNGTGVFQHFCGGSTSCTSVYKTTEWYRRAFL